MRPAAPAPPTSATDEEKLSSIMRSLKVGSTLELSVFRDGEVREIHYVLPARALLPGDLPEQQANLPQTTLSPKTDRH